jgi:hypothetical protein
MIFPETTLAWRRLKLSLAELLVLGTIKSDVTAFYTSRALEIAEDIKDIKDTYYPRPQS